VRPHRDNGNLIPQRKLKKVQQGFNGSTGLGDGLKEGLSRGERVKGGDGPPHASADRGCERESKVKENRRGSEKQNSNFPIFRVRGKGHLRRKVLVLFLGKKGTGGGIG